MTDPLSVNYGGATHPGARAIVHPGMLAAEHAVARQVVQQTATTFTLDDGYTYDKVSCRVVGPGGQPSLLNRMAVTEGSAMYSSWSHLTRPPRLSEARHPARRRLHSLARILRERCPRR